jgi:hypothetical protein
MGQHVFPAPPLGSLRRRIINWLKQQWKKEPVGFIALLVTILTILSPWPKSCYYEFVGPDLKAVVSFQYEPTPNSLNEMVVQVENYSGIPAQGLRLTLKSLGPKVARLERSELVFGTIGPNSISSREVVPFLAEEPGTTTVEIEFKAATPESNVKEHTQAVSLTVKGP